mmetsp:Transcript_63122/g.169265  ORF Transcript_63122/g.169265 Transcript_63122/m.169265 type:complete len:145 (+) Transcript_63122:117-551(+)
MIFIHPIMGIFVGLCLSFVTAQVVGLLILFDMPIDMVTFVVLSMAIGFEIEYVVHIAHAFMRTTGTGVERLRTCLRSMGYTVFWAFASTAVQSLLFLIVARSQTFKTFSLVLVIVVVLGGFAGFSFVPSTLAAVVDLTARSEKS